MVFFAMKKRNYKNKGKLFWVSQVEDYIEKGPTLFAVVLMAPSILTNRAMGDYNTSKPK
jgi:hypothetical protein